MYENHTLGFFFGGGETRFYCIVRKETQKAPAAAEASILIHGDNKTIRSVRTENDCAMGHLQNLPFTQTCHINKEEKTSWHSLNCTWIHLILNSCLRQKKARRNVQFCCKHIASCNGNTLPQSASITSSSNSPNLSYPFTSTLSPGFRPERISTCCGFCLPISMGVLRAVRPSGERRYIQRPSVCW